MSASVDRRGFLTRALPATAAVLVGAPQLASAGTRRPLALVYRGAAASPGCPESVAALLRRSPSRFRTEFCGPHERTALTAEALSSATLYAQPGGTDLPPAWRHMRPHADAIRAFVHGGGHYLGFCLGGYLAGLDPGFALLPGDSGEYVESRGAEVTNLKDTIVSIRWRGQRRRVYFQDGPYFTLRPHSRATVLARYENGLAAAVVARCGAG
ncbi:MAG: BPL-N domain-containing protein, partial [Solirubrobacteraceae bacterium]